MHPQPLQRQGRRLSPSPAQTRCKIRADRSGRREGNKFLRFLMQVRNEQGSASRKTLLSTKRQGSLRSFQAFNLSVTLGGVAWGRCLQAPCPAALSSLGRRAQSQQDSPALTSPSHWAEIRSCPVSKAPWSALGTSDKAGREASGEQGLARVLDTNDTVILLTARQAERAERMLRAIRSPVSWKVPT